MKLIELTQALNAKRVPFKHAPNGEIAMHCVKCRDHQYHMHVNIDVYKHGVQGWGYCYKNGCSTPLYRIIQIHGLDVKYAQHSKEITAFDQFESLIYTLKTGAKSKPLPPPAIDTKSWYDIVDNNAFMAKKALAYLEGRGFTRSQIKVYQLKYADSGVLEGRVIIPFYDHGKLVYYQARDFTGRSEYKVLNPPKADFVLGKSEYLFNLDLAREYSQVVICEGWASAMSAGYNGVAIGGKSCSDVQLRKLTQHWSDFVVMLDEGTERESLKLAANLLRIKPKSTVRVVKLPTGDPNDHPFKSLCGFMQEAQEVTIQSILEYLVDLEVV